MQWVPAHCGFPGNEKANLEPKEDSMQDNSVTFQEKKTLIRAAQGQHSERDDTLSLAVVAGCGHETIHAPQQTQCQHVQENEAGTITYLQLRSSRPDGRTYTAEMPTSADSRNKCVANGSPVTHQTLRQQEGTGENSHIHLSDWLSVQRRSKRRSSSVLNIVSELYICYRQSVK